MATNKNIIVDKDIHFKILAEIARLKGGEIKEGEVYINKSTKMTFIDKLNNEFKMAPDNVKSGQWSPFESGNVFNNPEYHMKKLKEIALSRGGKIKEGEVYTNAHTKMIFIDKLGNEFKMKPNSVKNGIWSPFESGNVFNNPEYHMRKLKEIALSRGGKIKEGEIYTNAHTKMTFIDHLGNEFKIIPNAVKNGSWSPYEKNYSEHICRQIIEQLYNKKFPSCWDIISREGKRSLQLDGYNAKLKIAFEYQGEQHTLGWFNKDEKQKQKDLIDSQERDKEKKQICLDKDILLLEINYYKTTKNIQDLINQTINDVKKSYEINNKNIPDFINNVQTGQIKIDLSKISHLIVMQKQLEEIALSKGGKIKDGEMYISSNTKMTFIDKLNNEFEMTSDSVKQGCWSPYESGNVFNNPEYHIKKLKEIALSKEGKIKEGEVYVNKSTKMKFIDKLNNEFEMTPDSVKQGCWSPYEAGKVRDSKYHMKELEKIALSKGGKIKEDEYYINAHTKMTFIDKLGNEFKMIPNSVKNGSWSPYESGHIRDPEYHMKELKEIALSRGGRIKENAVYINNSTKMTFIDKVGNEFEMAPSSVKRGQWSPLEYQKNLKDISINKVTDSSSLNKRKIK